jgi:glycosyltransferase involved in cell wall biosynthesis
MSSLTFSIVLPVYNVAPYLPACLDSLAALDPQPDEIIAVDDGSTDACPQILADYAGRLPCLRVIRQENGGLSAARNTGLAAASGKYLAFLDSDDFLAPQAYRAALALAERDHLEMVLFNGRYHFEGRQDDRPIYNDAESTGTITGRDWLDRRFRAGRFLHMVWMHLYRREFILQHAFQFVPGLIHEDVIWTSQVLLAAKRAAYLDQVAVNYRIPVRRPPPEVRQRQLERIVASSIVNAQKLAELSATLTDDVGFRRLWDKQWVDGALSVFHKLKHMPDRSVARTQLIGLIEAGFFTLLWQHATDFPQHRRIARHWLQARLLSCRTRH